MKKWRQRQWIKLASVTVALIGVLLVLPAFDVCTDYAYVCENTGSHKGHRKWFFGTQTGAWDYQSPLDTFMQQAHPDQLTHRWVSYMGTGRNVFGGVGVQGHGRPLLSLLRLAQDLESYFATLSPERKLALYRIFSTGDRATVQATVDEIVEASLALALNRKRTNGTIKAPKPLPAI